MAKANEKYASMESASGGHGLKSILLFQEVMGVEVTTTAWTDSEVFEGLLDQVKGTIDQVSAEGVAYDTEKVYAAAAALDCTA
jgi:hypothetical protein